VKTLGFVSVSYGTFGQNFFTELSVGDATVFVFVKLVYEVLDLGFAGIEATRLHHPLDLRDGDGSIVV